MFASQRYLNTDTTTTSGDGGTAIPPPGFNTSEAKKPLPRDISVTKHTRNEATIPVKAERLGGSPGTEAAVAKPGSSGDKDNAVVLATNEKTADKKKDEKKTTVWQKVKHGVQHFWDGTKLLGVEIKISSNLALKMAAGYELSRRERRQV